jgi:hypothetical protein
MSKIPDYLREHFNETLLGRLRLALFKQITGNDESVPTDQEVRHFIVEQYRLNATVGELLLGILSTKSIRAAEYAQLQEPNDLSQLLRALDENPLEKAHFLEIIDCPEPLPCSLGALVYCEELREGGYVYTVTLLDDKEFPDHFAGRAEIRSSQVAPEPAFGILGHGEYESYSLNDYRNDPFVVFMTQILNHVHNNRAKYLISLTELGQWDLHAPPALKPPTDKKLLMLLQLVRLGKVKCAEAEVELSLVKPHNLDFCLSYPLDVVDELVRRAQNGSLVKLLVYWSKGAFVMSDDYGYYLAYRKLGYPKVPVVIMGPFPEKITQPTRVGGIDLIPPVTISQEGGYSSLSPELREFVLESRLQRKTMSKAVSNLYVLCLFLARLIQDPHTKEKQLHKFILENPVIIDPYGLHVETEVRLGNDYRIDLAIQYAFTDKRILLIELERANIPIFTKKGRPRAKVTHAIQQVEDWLRWWRENPFRVPKPLDGSLPAEGLVVIGRSIDLDEDAKRRLLNLNHNRKVKVITYDDLLERLVNLIKLLESENEEKGAC